VAFASGCDDDVRRAYVGRKHGVIDSRLRPDWGHDSYASNFSLFMAVVVWSENESLCEMRAQQCRGLNAEMEEGMYTFSYQPVGLLALALMYCYPRELLHLILAVSVPCYASAHEEVAISQMQCHRILRRWSLWILFVDDE
jgi:hypothetical protein